MLRAARDLKAPTASFDTYIGSSRGTSTEGRGMEAENGPRREAEAILERPGRWTARPVLSSILRIGIFLLPIACALLATSIARSLIPEPTSRIQVVSWWMGLLGVGLAVAVVTERLARRLLPLAALLRLSMLFPDEAPSRFRVARQAGSLRQLQVKAIVPQGDPSGTATSILALVARLSTHDRRTRGHAERVRVYTDLIAEEMRIPEEDRYRLRWAALLHDIGKLSVDADVLNKTDELSDGDWDDIRRHPAEGLQQIGTLAGWLGPWAETISHHHERWDGTGYPVGLAGEQIFIGARIVAVADAYDTMTSVRSYKLPVAARAAREELVACAGSQFDPAVVRAFLAISLPRLLWATGPLSLLVHIPLLARFQAAGEVGLASAAQAVVATTAAGVIVAGLVAPIALPVVGAAPLERASAQAEAERMRHLDPHHGAVTHPNRAEDRNGGKDRNTSDPGETEPPADGGASQTQTPTSTPPPSPKPSPTAPSEPPSPEPPPVETATVPDVVGMSLGDGTAALEDAGFEVVVVKEWSSDPSEKNTITKQSEPAGSELEIGSTVTITVTKFRNKG
jgi:HD-GYP domain-containing protein (c-di-GMP phosphodiesterase class II)